MTEDRVLVTGANGLLGSTLCPILSDSGFEVLTQSRNGSTDYRCDLTLASEVENLLTQASPNFVLNLAAMASVDLCEKDPQAAYLGNVKIVENFRESLKAIKGSKTHFIHISTDMVYDSSAPSKEDSVCIRNHYAASKIAGEHVALGIGGTVLRTNFFGRSIANEKKSFSDWLVNSFKSGQPFKLVADSYFSPLLMETLAEQIAAVIRKPTAGVFNLGSHDGMSKKEFGLKLAELLGLNSANAVSCTLDSLKLPAPRPLGMQMNIEKFEKTYKTQLPRLVDEISKLRRLNYE